MDTNGNLRELLLKDLCSRLPYGVIGVSRDGVQSPLLVRGKAEWDIITSLNYRIVKYGWKPYLRPMDSMTEEEVEEYRSIQSDIWKECGTQYYDNWSSISWLYEHNFNVSLPEHLFIKVTNENNPYK